MTEIAVLLVGDAERGEFRQARASLETLTRVTRAADLDQAAELLRAGPLAPELIVLVQSRPGEFSAAAVDRLRMAAPLARIVALLGSWCEGEMRTGRPLPGVIRVYWHQWLPRFRQELERIRRGWCPAWGLPATAGEEERLLSATRLPLAQRGGLVAVAVRPFAMADWLSSACRLAGYATVWLQPSRPARIEGAAAVLWDGDDCRRQWRSELVRLRAELGPLPLLALLDFPRVEDCDAVLAAGATAVLSKPLLVDDLLWSLEEFAGR
jgi:hypothetical protein